MIRSIYLGLAAILILGIGAPAKPLPALSVVKEIPRAATVEIILLKAPGLNAAGSRWEVAYQFRIANEVTLWEAGRLGQFKPGSEARVGELIREAGVKKLLQSTQGQTVVFQIPFGPQIQERLRKQPAQPITVTPDTPASIKLSREQEAKMQAFLFYSVINIYDATLKRNITIPLMRTWDFRDYPEARFKIKIEINSDGSYRLDTPLPERSGSR